MTSLPTTMRAAVLSSFGSPQNVEIATLPIPKPKSGEVLIRVTATAVNSGDVRIRGKDVPKGYKFLMGLMLGFSKPRIPILGTVFAGEVVAVGAKVKAFTSGQRVFGSTELKMGTHAEYLTIHADKAIAPTPGNLSDPEAVSLIFGTTTALHFLNKAKLKQGESVLINGASGAVGLAMLQIAKARGAHVTAVATAKNHDLLTQHGADEVIDYNTTNIADLAQRFDILADCVGTTPYATHKNLLKPKGRFALVVGTLAEGLGTPLVNLFGSRKIVGGTAIANSKTMQEISDLSSQGAISPIVDRVFALNEIQKAHAYVNTGRKTGSVIVTP